MTRRRARAYIGALAWAWAMLAAAAPASATNYYINSRTGNDTNAGTGRESAWKGFANLETRRFLPGDSILFVVPRSGNNDGGCGPPFY